MSRIFPWLLVLVWLPAACLAGSPAALVPPGPFSTALSLVESNKAPEAIRALSVLQPKFRDLGPYHYVYARASALAGKPLEAASHYHRAAVYAASPALQETALFLTAETNFGLGYLFEAKTDLRIFLKKFPQSWLAPKARVLLGRCLSGIGRHRDAVREFELAGNSPDALFGKANALQRAGMTDKAARAYAAAVTVDPRFPLSSGETRCWMGENLRLSGHLAKARELLQSVQDPGLRDYAEFGLGEIAASESKTDEALRRFGSVAASRDRKLGRIALLRISDIDADAGKQRESVARLDEIIAKYPFTEEYDQALLRLARSRAAAGNPASALSLLSKIVLRPSTMRREALDEIERILLAARGKGAAQLAVLWNAGGRWLMDASREKTLVVLADEIRGTGAPYFEVARWLARYGSNSVRRKYLTLLSHRYAEIGDTAGLQECLAGLKALSAGGDDVARAEAYIKFAQKDYRGAAGRLLSISKLNSGDVSMLGDVLPHAPDPRKATAAVEAEVARTGASAHVLGRLADTLYDEGRKTEAIKFYRMAAEKDPENEWSCYRLTVLLGRDGGEKYKNMIRKDPMLVRMANAAWREQALDAR